MQVCVDESEGRRDYVNIELCRGCEKHRWGEEEYAEVKKAARLIFLLADYNNTMLCGTPHMDPREFPGRVALYEPLRQPFQFDGDELRLLLGALQLAAFIGISEIQLGFLTMAYNKIQRLIRHIKDNHTHEGQEHLIPSYCFEPAYPQRFNPESLLLLLPSIRSMSHKEIETCCQRVLEGAYSISERAKLYERAMRKRQMKKAVFLTGLFQDSWNKVEKPERSRSRA